MLYLLIFFRLKTMWVKIQDAGLGQNLQRGESQKYLFV